MSTILKALRRLEDERAAASRQTLHDEVVASSSGNAGSGRRAVWLFAALGLGTGALLTGALALLWLPGPTTPANSVAVPVPVPAPVVPEPASPPAVMAALPDDAETPKASLGHEPPPAPSFAVVARSPAKSNLRVEEPLARVAAPPPRGSVPPSAGIAAVEGQSTENAGASKKPAATRLASTIPRKRYARPPEPALPAKSAKRDVRVLPAEMTGSIPGPTPAFLAAEEVWQDPEDGAGADPLGAPPKPDPWLGERLPRPAALARAEPSASALPEVSVLRTVWHPQADRRTAEVQIDGSSETLLLREGDQLGPLLLVAIEPSGIVLHHEGEELRRRIGR